MADVAFQAHYVNFKHKIKANSEEFCTLADNASRIRFAYTFFEEYKDLDKSGSKNFEEAQALNVHADERCDLSVYNEAIRICPQDDLEGKQLYACLISNRSELFFKDCNFEKVLQDVAFLKQYGHLQNPDEIAFRGRKALEALHQTKEIVLEDDGTVKSPLPKELTWCSGNPKYPALSNKLKVETDNSGRHVVIATGDFKTGEIVSIEHPYVSVVTEDTSNCDYCAISTNQIYACPKCKTVYCSYRCMQKALVYHQYECVYTGLSIPNVLRVPWRIITQRSLQQVIEEEAHASVERKVDVYKTEDYYNVSRLGRDDHAQDRLNCADRIFYAVFLLDLLRTTEYFGSKATSRNLSEEEVLVGEVLIKSLQIINNNRMEISEKQSDTLDVSDVGTGVYPTMSLFKHSCDPSVAIYCIQNVQIFRSFKAIKTGDVVYVTFGAQYSKMTKQERIDLMALYGIACTCQACVDDWPQFNDMTPDILRGLCDCGGFIYYSTLDRVPSGRCANCSRKKRVPKLKHLNATFEKADELYGDGHFEDAWKLFAKNIDLMSEYLAQPFSYFLLHQIRLEGCFRRIGNKRFDYEFKYDEGVEPFSCPIS